MEVSFDQILKDAEELQKHIDKPLQSMHVGATLGWSPDSVRFLQQGPEAIAAALQKSRDMGHGMLKQHTDDLQEAYLKYKQMAETLDSTANRIASVFAPAVGAGLDLITNAIASNQDTLEAWASSANRTFENFLNGVTGNLDKAADRMSAFNNQLSKDNVQSPDPEVRKAEFKERVDTSADEYLASGVRLVADLVGDIATLSNPVPSLEAAYKRGEKIQAPV